MYNTNNPYYTQVPPYNQVNPIPQQRVQPYQDVYNVEKNMMKCRAVTSAEEARAAMIDLDGSVSVFTDFGNKKIYTKQINLDGTATLNTYELVENVEPEKPKPEPQYYQPDLSGYVKEKELDAAFNQLSDRIYEISDQLEECKKAMANQAKAASKTGAKK